MKKAWLINVVDSKGIEHEVLCDEYTTPSNESNGFDIAIFLNGETKGHFVSYTGFHVVNTVVVRESDLGLTPSTEEEIKGVSND